LREAIVVVVVARSGRRRLRAGLRVDFNSIVAVGVAEVEPGAAGVEDVLGGGGCGGEESFGSVNCQTEVCVSKGGLRRAGHAGGFWHTYWYSRLEGLGVEDMVGGVFCVFGIQSGEERLCKAELAHVGGFQLVAQALCEAAQACKTVSWTAIRNRVFWSRRDRGDRVQEFLVQGRGIHASIK
jgi:hypothetical protein